MARDFVFASESVTAGHPDKLCDQISDAIVDRFLMEDPRSRVVAESAVSTSILFLSVRQASRAKFDVAEVARGVIAEAGYDTNGEFDARDCTIMTSMQELPRSHLYSEDLASMSDADLDRVVPDHHVTAFGYACDHTSVYMPLPVVLAHRLARRLSELRGAPGHEWLMPDGMTQVGVEFRDRRPARLHSLTVVASQRMPEHPSPTELRNALVDSLLNPVIRECELDCDPQTRIFVNPEGPVIVGGPALHAGLTGRKTAMDTYGEYARHSGAALSGKDPLRIDRVGTYAARYAAKNIVAAGLAQECEVQLSYSIGQAQPVSVQVQTFGTARLDEESIAERLRCAMDLRLGGIVRRFDLQSLPGRHGGVFYRRLAAYGQVGRADMELPWEALDLVPGL